MVSKYKFFAYNSIKHMFLNKMCELWEFLCVNDYDFDDYYIF